MPEHTPGEVAQERLHTRAEFEAAYLANSSLTSADMATLRAYERFAIPCTCGDELCLGWQMAHGVESDVREYILALESQREELLAALERLTTMYDANHIIRALLTAADKTSAIDSARAAIAKAKGGKL